jgi:hypothetical protein
VNAWSRDGVDRLGHRMSVGVLVASSVRVMRWPTGSPPGKMRVASASEITTAISVPG